MREGRSREARGENFENGCAFTLCHFSLRSFLHLLKKTPVFVSAASYRFFIFFLSQKAVFIIVFLGRGGFFSSSLSHVSAARRVVGTSTVTVLFNNVWKKVNKGTTKSCVTLDFNHAKQNFPPSFSNFSLKTKPFF